MPAGRWLDNQGCTRVEWAEWKFGSPRDYLSGHFAGQTTPCQGQLLKHYSANIYPVNPRIAFLIWIVPLHVPIFWDDLGYTGFFTTVLLLIYFLATRSYKWHFRRGKPPADE